MFWKPIWNILEGSIHLILVNARHIWNVPGRKTDVKDCDWIAQLLQHGLLRASFVPPREQRELRDLTRHRSQLVAEQSRISNRVHKILEDANIKLSSVATDVRTALVQAAWAAWAASHTRQTYLSSPYRRLAGRRGKKRAIVALGHTMLVTMYHMLRDGVDYQELGQDWLDKLQPQRLTRYLVKRLESLGHTVTLSQAA